MAMTNCKECGGSVSSEALICPHCGVAAPALTQDQKAQVVQFSMFARSRAFAGVLFFGGIGWLVLAGISGAGSDAVASAFGPAKWMIGVGALWYIIAEIDRNLAERKSKK